MSDFGEPLLHVEIQAADDLLAELRSQMDGEETDEQLLRDMVEGSTNLHEAIRAAMDRLEYLEDDVLAADARIKQLQSRKSARERSIETIKVLLHRALTRTGISPFKEPGRYTLSLRLNPAKLAVDIDPSDLPPEYMVVTVAPDRAKLKEALKAGDEIDGVSLVDGGTALSIRRL